MKKNFITDWAKYFAGVFAVSAMLLVTSCGDSNRSNNETGDAEYGMGADPDASGSGVADGDVDRTSNNYASQRNYDVNTMGTAAKNRRQMEASGKNLSDQDYQRLRTEYDDLNNQMRDSYRQSPGLSMRYTDDHRTADHSYDYYGVYYDNVNDNQARSNFSQMEQRRMDLKNQMRGKIDKKTGAYLAAEMDAVPKEGYDHLYQHLSSQMNQAQNKQGQNTQGQGQNSQAADMSGTVFVEFVVDKNGKVTNPKVIDVLEGQASAGNMSGTGTTTGAAGTSGTTGTGTNTGTGTSGEGTTDNATNTGMSPNSTGTVGSGNTAGTAGTTTGTTGNSTASGNDGAQAGQSGQAASDQTTQNQQNRTQSGTTGTAGTQAGTTGTQRSTSAQTKQLEQQALNAIKSTSGMWEPAQMDGKPVASIVQMPIPVGRDAMGSSGQMNNGNMNNRTNPGGTNTNDRTNQGGTKNNNTGVEGGTNVNPGSGTQNGGRTSTGTVNTGSGTNSTTTDTDGGR